MIWRLLNLSGYRNNLRHANDMDVEVGLSASPRKILSSPAVYQVIYSILNNQTFQAVHLIFYRLLTMLETDHQLCNYIKEHTKTFLDTESCIYRLSYGLESLIKELENNVDLYV